MFFSFCIFQIARFYILTQKLTLVFLLLYLIQLIRIGLSLLLVFYHLSYIQRETTLVLEFSGAISHSYFQTCFPPIFSEEKIFEPFFSKSTLKSIHRKQYPGAPQTSNIAPLESPVSLRGPYCLL